MKERERERERKYSRKRNIWIVASHPTSFPIALSLSHSFSLSLSLILSLSLSHSLSLSLILILSISNVHFLPLFSLSPFFLSTYLHLYPLHHSSSLFSSFLPHRLSIGKMFPPVRRVRFLSPVEVSPSSVYLS